MKNSPTIKQRVTQISIGAFLSAFVVILLTFLVYSLFQRDFSEREIQSELTRQATQQVEQLLPSFLLPEQSAGVAILLERFKKQESLTSIELSESNEAIKAKFSECAPSEDKISFCKMASSDNIITIVPISEGSRHFGYLVKSKQSAASYALSTILKLTAVFAAMLGATFIFVYIFIARLFSKTVPTSLDRLVEWIEADLKESPQKIEPLPFRDLELLREKISEVLVRHNSERDQAIIGQLTSGIMHDIKTPLQSMVSAMHMVAEQDSGSPKRTPRLELLYQATSDKLPIINEIIETTLDGSRQIRVNVKNIDLRKTAERVVEQTKELRHLRGVDVELIAPEEIVAPHDSVQFFRVLLNLVKNAIEAASEKSRNGKVILEIAKAGSKDIKLSVEDSGQGLPTSSDKVFGPFRSSKVHGSGLGLLISKKIVEAHLGKIRAGKSLRLGGACFEVTIPVLEVSGVKV